MYTIETHNLCKQYKDFLAVDSLSMKVNRGEIYAFLGLNGAGKTTTIRMLLGMIQPSHGYVTVLGQKIKPGCREPWERTGYLVESPNHYPEITVYENLEICRRLHPGTSRKSISDIIEQLSLGNYANQRAGTLSQGNKQRLGLAKAMLHEPELLILDEPANGLDPAGIVEIRNLLETMTREKGVTVFMSSHILGEVSRLAQRIGIIHKGKLLQELNAEELEKNRRRELLIKVHNMDHARHILQQGGCNPLTINNHLILRHAEAIQSPEIYAKMLVHANEPPRELVVHEEPLEDYFLRLIGNHKGNDNV